MKKILYTGDSLIIPYGLNETLAEIAGNPDKYELWGAPFPPDKGSMEKFDLTIVHFKDYPSIAQVMTKLDKDNTIPVVFTRSGIRNSDNNARPNCYVVDDQLLKDEVLKILS